MSNPHVLSGAATLPPAASKSKKRPGKQNRSSRFRSINAFVDVRMATLSRGEIAIWLVLWRDTKDGTVRTSQADIARRVGMTPNGVQKALKKLIAAGLVKLIRRGGINVGPSIYRVQIPND